MSAVAILRPLRARFAGKPRSYVWTRPTLSTRFAFKHCCPVASMYQACSRKRLASGQHWFSSRNADYIQASRASRSAGIYPRRSNLGSMFSSKGLRRPGASVAELVKLLVHRLLLRSIRLATIGVFVLQQHPDDPQVAIGQSYCGSFLSVTA